MKKIKPIVAGLLVVSVVLILAEPVQADQRAYVWTYEYITLPRGEGEIETYFTISTPDKNDFEGNTTVEHKLEIEVGMTDRFDFAVYQVFTQLPGDTLKYKGFQFRTRYRIGDKGKYPVDTLVYLEYKGVPDFSEHGVETKLILAKDIGRFNMSLNPVVEFETGDENELKIEYALGLSYEINNLMKIGAEAKGNEYGHYAGPVISHGNERFWVALGSSFNLGNVEENKPEFLVRMLMGMGL